MSFLLISPPLTGMQLPRGLLEMASFLQAMGHETSLLPLGFWFDAFNANTQAPLQRLIEEAVSRTGARVVGIGAPYSIAYPECLRLLGMVREIDKTVVTVMGGPHVTFLDEESVRSPDVDIVVRGEGEWTMAEILSTLQQGGDCTRISGITLKSGGRIVRTPDRAPGDLGELPPVDFSLLPSGFVANCRTYGMLNRGCRFKCRFCSESRFWGRRRSFAVSRTIQEMIILQERYGRPMDCIDESSLDIGSAQFRKLCAQIIARGIRLPNYFHVLSRVDTLSDEGIELMRQAGIGKVIVGIESASDSVRAMMNKRISMEQVESACRRLASNGIRINSFWMVGHPGDTPKEAERSLKTMEDLFKRNLITSAIVVPFLPYPGTPFFDRPERYGLEILTRDWTQWDRFTKPVIRLKAFSEERIFEYINRMRQSAQPYNTKDYTV